MNLTEYTQAMRPAIEISLQEYIQRTLPENLPELRQMIAYHMGWEGEGAGREAQGKRIRPLLVLLCAESAGGQWQDALPAAIAVELLHNFSLIHDDIQDNSPLRRNRQTVWVKWGIAQAINAGDVLFTLAFAALHDLAPRLAAAHILRANQILQQTCLQLTEGQYLDISYEAKTTLPVDNYWPMVSGKTAALLRCCCELGALSAGAAAEQQSLFGEYGRALGLAFQVYDDWLGIWGDAAFTGKSTESDLVSGKKSLPVVLALAQNGAFAQHWRQGPIQPEEAPRLANVLREEGISAETLQTADRLTAQALEALQKAASQPQPAEALANLTHALLRRKS